MSESGVYSCITEKIYPPPYKQSCQRIQVNVTGKTRTHKLIKTTIAFHSVCEIMNCLIVSMFVCLSLCVTQVSLLCPFTSCMSKSSVFLGVVRAPDAVRSVCSMSSFLYDRVCCVRVHLPPTYMPNSDINSKNESSSYEPGNSIIYLFCLFSTYNRIELCEVRLNPKTFKFLLQSLTKLKTKTSAGELQPPGVWLRSLHITDSDKETFHTQSLTPCLIRLFDHSYAESLQLVGPHVCLCGQKIESPCKQY